ncbi:MAG: ABC transporter ATP-binding protein [Acidimicrobiales bacterium]
MRYQESAVEVENLKVCYGEKVAVASLDLRVAAGEVVALLGRNGAGKTSTVETLEGYRRPTQGRVRVLGLDPSKRSEHRALASKIGVMLQKGGVYPGMGAKEALRLFGSFYDNPMDVDELVEDLELTGVSKTPWRRLSGGEQQRVSLALALVGRPAVAFLDEPTAGVDPRGRLVIRDKVAALRRDGAAVLVTTHELDEADRIADRIAIMDRGRLVALGSPSELVSRSPRSGQIHFNAPAGIDTSSLAFHISADVQETAPGAYTVSAGRDTGPKNSGDLVGALTAWLAAQGLPLGSLRVGASLEDVFLDVTGGSGEREVGR